MTKNHIVPRRLLPVLRCEFPRVRCEVDEGVLGLREGAGQGVQLGQDGGGVALQLKKNTVC